MNGRADPSDPRTGGDTRARLLGAAQRCVRDKGIAGATSREITAAAGANLAAITYHFGSKDELLAEALFGEIERRVRPALDRLSSSEDPAAAMVDVVRELLAEFERSKRDTVVYLEALLLATRDAAYRRRTLKLYRSIGRHLEDLIVQLRDAGVVPAWVNPAPMASLVLAVANGIALQTCLDPSGPRHDALGAQFASLLLAAGGSASA